MPARHRQSLILEVDTLVTDSLLHPEARGLLSEQAGELIIAAAEEPAQTASR